MAYNSTVIVGVDFVIAILVYRACHTNLEVMSIGIEFFHICTIFFFP